MSTTSKNEKTSDFIRGQIFLQEPELQEWKPGVVYSKTVRKVQRGDR